MIDAQLQADLARAHGAFAAGDLVSALAIAESIIARAPTFAAARQIAAVVERRNGRTKAARAHFEAALDAAPGDAHVLNSYANLLADIGELTAARAHYQRALAIAPSHIEALVNLALVCKRLGDLASTRAALEQAVTQAPAHARAWQALGVLHADGGAWNEAALMLDQALALEPDNVRALRARGQVEAERGGDATPFYARARGKAPEDPELALAEATALHRKGESETARERLEALVSANPGYEPAHAALASIRWQAGDSVQFTESYEVALASLPSDPSLWRSYFGVLMRAGRPEDVLSRLEKARAALGGVTDRFEAAAATEAGDIVRADRAFAQLAIAGDPGLEVSHLRHLLRAGRPEAAISAALPIVERADGHGAWPYLASAWRLTGDPRWNWLEGDPTFVRTFDLRMTDDDLAQLAAKLRKLHRTRSAPFDQTLRSGSQTDGDLFESRDPAIDHLKAQLSEAIDRYIADLPPEDPRHPLLRHGRAPFRFSGAWSVRLLPAGLHVNHVHTKGWISSAFYVALPEDLGQTAEDGEGWIAFGEPPVELGLKLRPFQLLRPQPGRLALFPSTMWHGTRPFHAGERLTVAFDVVPADADHSLSQ